MNFENFKLFLLAYTLGRISPISKIKNVITITSIKKTKSIFKPPKLSSESIPLNKTSPKDANNRTIAIFIKLLATSIEASNFFGCVRSSIMISKDFDLVFLASSKSFWVREKSATSAPEISPEAINSTKSPMRPGISDEFKSGTMLKSSEFNYIISVKKLIKKAGHWVAPELFQGCVRSLRSFCFPI